MLKVIAFFLCSCLFFRPAIGKVDEGGGGPNPKKMAVFFEVSEERREAILFHLESLGIDFEEVEVELAPEED